MHKIRVGIIRISDALSQHSLYCLLLFFILWSEGQIGEELSSLNERVMKNKYDIWLILSHLIFFVILRCGVKPF